MKIITLCCFVVYSTRQFVVCLSMCHFVLVFFSPFSIAITSLGEERANLRVFVRLFGLCLFEFVGFLYLLGLGRAAVCDCSTPWTFLLPFFGIHWKRVNFLFILLFTFYCVWRHKLRHQTKHERHGVGVQSLTCKALGRQKKKFRQIKVILLPKCS